MKATQHLPPYSKGAKSLTDLAAPPFLFGVWCAEPEWHALRERRHGPLPKSAWIFVGRHYALCARLEEDKEQTAQTSTDPSTLTTTIQFYRYDLLGNFDGLMQGIYGFHDQSLRHEWQKPFEFRWTITQNHHLALLPKDGLLDMYRYEPVTLSQLFAEGFDPDLVYEMLDLYTESGNEFIETFDIGKARRFTEMEPITPIIKWDTLQRVAGEGCRPNFMKWLRSLLKHVPWGRHKKRD